MSLKMAPPALAIVSAAACLTAHAETITANPMEQVYSCVGIENDAERLACFDQSVASVKSRDEAGHIQTVDLAELETLEKEAFGFSLPSLTSIFRGGSSGAPKELEGVSEITAPVKSARIVPGSGTIIVTLENGQVWEQIDSRKLNNSAVRKAKEASIRKASFDSFILSLDGGAGIRAKRTS